MTPNSSTPRQRYTPAQITAVTFDDPFWAAQLQVNRERTIPHIHSQLARVGSIDAFRKDWEWPAEATRRHAWGGTLTMFWDSDLAKWLEAASYSLATHPDPKLDHLLDEIIELIAIAQQPDGYLNTWFISVDPANRWANLRDWHELYCAGHLIEAAVAHYQATGKRNLLDVLCRYADYIGQTFGVEPGKRRGYCGHPEIELALVRLAQATGEQRYLELSHYFVEERGNQPHYYNSEALTRGENPETFWARSYEYNQSHLPVRQQTQVVGHAVRAVYLYSAMADLAGAYGDQELLDVCDRLWHHLTTRRMYVMGGIGTSKQNEGFTGDYDLPNESAYAETCAAIGLIFWGRRMLQFKLDRRYTDIMELALYNGVRSGISLAGDTFFYDNPLASNGTHHRQHWFACPCCPPNLARIFASLGEYVYAQSEDEAVIHLYVQGSGTLHVAGQDVTLRQETRYPWDGAVAIHIDPAVPAGFTLRLRIPGWCANPTISVNGEPVDLQTQSDGYLGITRQWQAGDIVRLDLPMPVQRLYGHPAIAADVGQVTLRRGPLVYCLEQIDHGVPLHQIVLPAQAELTARFEPELLGGVVVIGGAALALNQADWNDTLYRTQPPETSPCDLTAIPYYAWDNRSAGAMQVWVQSI